MEAPSRQRRCRVRAARPDATSERQIAGELLDAALGYAARGWAVLPIEPRGQRPLGALAPHGLKDATCDPDVIRSWWARHARANVGLATGSSFDVLDIDGEAGRDALDRRRPPGAGGTPTVDGPTASTGKGWHCYVSATGLGNRAALIPGVDWRGKGGYVVAPPSVHSSGRRYAWLEGWGPDDVELRSPPPWLLELLTASRIGVGSATATTAAIPDGTRLGQRDRAYGRAALDREVGRLTLASEGSRNDQLNRSAFALGQLVASRHLQVDDVINALMTAAARCGLAVQEAEATIRSGILAGLDRPRRRPR